MSFQNYITIKGNPVDSNTQLFEIRNINSLLRSRSFQPKVLVQIQLTGNFTNQSASEDRTGRSKTGTDGNLDKFTTMGVMHLNHRI